MNSTTNEERNKPRRITQEEELDLAEKENRVPICLRCNHPLTLVKRRQIHTITWEYEEDSHEFAEWDPDDDSGNPKHICSQCSDQCKAILHDLYDYFW